MADAASFAAAATPAQPAPWRPDLATAKALSFLCLASLWVGFAAGGAASVTIAACDYDEACRVYQVLATTFIIRALVFAVLLAPIAPLLVVRAAVCDAGFREELIISLVRHLQAPRAPVWSMLRETIVRAFLAAVAFSLLGAVGCLVMMGLSPMKGSPTGWIGAMLSIVGTVGSVAISCFIIFPLMALKLWRMKLIGAAVAGSNV